MLRAVSGCPARKGIAKTSAAFATHLDQLVAAHLLKRLEEFAAVDGDGHRVDVVPIDHSRKPALPAQGTQVITDLGAGLELEADGRVYSQNFSRNPNWAPLMISQPFSQAQRAFTGTFRPFGRYSQCRMTLEYRLHQC